MAQSMVSFRMDMEVKKSVEEVYFHIFMEGINGFTDDCFTGNRELNVLPTEREEL